MIQQFVDRFMAAKEEMILGFKTDKPEDYSDIVKRVISVVGDKEGWDCPDPENITTIDHGEYQGTLVFVIAETGYQPSTYWYVKVSYGSCSGCDTFQAICGWGDEVTDQEAMDYWTLALHIVQNIKKMGDDQ